MKTVLPSGRGRYNFARSAMFFPFFFILLQWGCLQAPLEEIQPRKPSKPVATESPAIPLKPLMLSLSFEQSTDLDFWNREACCNFSLTRSAVRARKGEYALRVEINKNDPYASGSIRAELARDPEADGERWYGFSFFHPTEYSVDPVEEVVAQWHSVPDVDRGEDWRPPPVALQTHNGRYRMIVRWSDLAVNNKSNTPKPLFIDLGPYETNKWIDWRIHFRFSYKNDGLGLIQVWKNGVQILEHKGPNCYNDYKHPYFKIGLYKFGWVPGGSEVNSTTTKRVLFVDEIKIGDKSVSLVDLDIK